MYNYPCYRQIPGMTAGGQPAPMFPTAPIGTTLPSGMPAGTYMTPMPVPAEELPQVSAPAPETLQNTTYLPGFLKTQIGKTMRVQFLIGTTGPLVDRIGTLLGVGANYILMRPQESDDIISADLYSIKFVDIFQ